MPAFPFLRSLALSATIVLAPLTARAADLVVWWEKGFNPEEDAAVHEMIAEFENKTGKTVELQQPGYAEFPDRMQAAIDSGHPPDFAFAILLTRKLDEWAYQGRLVELADVVGPLVIMFDPDAIEAATKYNARTGRRALYGLPVGGNTAHIHVWRSLLEQAGFKLEDIPKDWEPFWSFWCDKVQPAVRKALGREDIWAVGAPMSPATSNDTQAALTLFMSAYGTHWVPPDNRLVFDDPERRARLVQALRGYTALYKEGCTPPDSVGWDDFSNNKAFLNQRVVMVVNSSLSIPNALRTSRPDDYFKNSRTIELPRGALGQPLAIDWEVDLGVIPREASHIPLAKEFVRFLVEDGWIGHYAAAAGHRLLPMRKLLDAPFWLDPSDPHLMMSAIQALTQPRLPPVVSNADAWRTWRIHKERLWAKAVHRVAADGINPEQAVDEAIARMAEIWALPAPE